MSSARELIEQENKTLRERLKHELARVRELEKGAITHMSVAQPNNDGVYHMTTKITVDEQRERRDRLDRMVGRLLVPRIDPDTSWNYPAPKPTVENAAVYIAAVDAHLAGEGGK